MMRSPERPQPPTAVQTVHLVFKTHLDLGFTGLAHEVTQQYLGSFIPGAMQLADELRQTEGERFVWTTGSWLIHTALEAASPSERHKLEQAIGMGDLVWHALPYTVHSEVLTVPLFEQALGYSRELDQRFGRVTRAAKMTDVPGHTRGIVPLLSEAGVTFLHLGVNPASSAPQVPDVFRWQSPGGQELIVAYDKAGYGGLVAVPGCPDALCLIHTNDNLGPPSAAAVRAAFEQARAAFPGAAVVASTLDAFAEALEKVRLSLPVVTAEIGDTWIHGVGSDPTRIRRFRTLGRLHADWQARGESIPEAFGRELMKVGEHTWGLDVKTFLKDDQHFTPAQLEGVLEQPNFQRMEASWAEQSAYLDAALETLNGTPQLDEARRLLAAGEPRFLSTAGLTRQDLTEPLSIGHFTVRVDGDGGLSDLTPLDGSPWATPQHRLGTLTYQVYGAEDYAGFYRDYVTQNEEANTAEWAPLDFTKPGLEHVLQRGQTFTPAVESLWSGTDQLLLELAFPLEAQALGAPGQVQVQIRTQQGNVHWDVNWLSKPQSRVAEALWLGFSPPVSEPHNWQLHKLGQSIDPLEVVPGGNRHLHAVDTGVSCDEMDGRWHIHTLDAPLVASGLPALLRFSQQPPDLAQGMHFNLYNNVWGTNFRMWFGEAARFRFVMQKAEELSEQGNE